MIIKLSTKKKNKYYYNVIRCIFIAIMSIILLYKVLGGIKEETV